jgi:hypothetical protein
MTTIDADPSASLRRAEDLRRSFDVNVDAVDAAPSTTTPAPDSSTEPAERTPASAAAQAGARQQSAGEEERRRAALLNPVTTTDASPRAARGLSRREPATPATPSTTPAAPTTEPSPALLARVDELERTGRTGFARDPAAAAAHARAVADVLPQVDPETRRALQRPLDDIAVAAANGDARARAVVDGLTPALSTRGVDALNARLLSAPDAAPRDRTVETVRRVAEGNAFPLVRQQAAGGILNDRSTVERALRGEHPSISREQLADLARPRPERVNQLLDVARDLDQRDGTGIGASLQGAGLARSVLPEVGGVLGGVIDGVDSLAAPFLHPIETVRGVATLGAAPVGTARAIGSAVVDAVREDPARAIVGGVIGSIGPGGHARRAAVAGHAAEEVARVGVRAAAARADDVARVEASAGRAGAALGDLRPHEVREVQNIVEEAQRRIDHVLQSVGAAPGELPVDIVVIGSAARGARRNADTQLPFGKGPGTRSDIDYAVPDRAVSDHVFSERGLSRADEAFWRQLPGFDTRTVGGQLHHTMPSTTEPRIWFRAGRDPMFLPPGAPNPTIQH